MTEPTRADPLTLVLVIATAIAITALSPCQDNLPGLAAVVFAVLGSQWPTFPGRSRP
jgi:hypothetical protein